MSSHGFRFVAYFVAFSRKRKPRCRLLRRFLLRDDAALSVALSVSLLAAWSLSPRDDDAVPVCFAGRFVAFNSEKKPLSIQRQRRFGSRFVGCSLGYLVTFSEEMTTLCLTLCRLLCRLRSFLSRYVGAFSVASSLFFEEMT
jgi:hypothetical protein